jgi:galactosyl transferase GMA12/MNN10 family
MDTGDSDAASRLQLILKHNRLDLLDKSRIALVMFDSRYSQNGTYWYAAAQWNSAYCNSQGHRFVYYSMHNSTCRSSNTSVVLNPVWCKVKAMQRAQQDLGDEVDFFVYMDSDAVVSQPFANFSLNDLLLNMTHKLNWNTEERPFVFNQESKYSWWCARVLAPSRYFYCLNTGTVVWRSSARATQVLERWWESALDPYETEEFTADNKTNIRFEFRTRWPWEQDRAMFLVHANDTIASYIQVAPHPHNRQMDEELVKSDWCLSNCPNRVRCFVAHNYEGGEETKIMMRDLYTNYSQIYYNVTSSDRNFDVAFLD